jgi:hypothetical protein
LTAGGKSQGMRWLAVGSVILSLFVLSAAAGAGGVPPFPRLPGTWSHAEINVSVNKQPHTLILDRGKIVQVSAAQVTLRERDRSVVVVPLAPRTIVNLYGFASTAAALQKGMTAQTMRIDGGTAVRVRAGS